jgi:exodeoxyribonuclease-3
MKVCTWNVNGIRAREAEVLAWVERERPDVLCLQEIKASPDKVPAALCALEGYWCYWHGHKGYSGVGLHLRKETFPDKPDFSHPEFDHETRIVVAQVQDLVFASIYVPNGGKDFPAKLRFLEAMEIYVRVSLAQGKRLVLCGDINIARTEKDVHPTMRNANQIGQTEGERQLFERILGEGLVDLSRQFEPDNDRLFTWWAPWRNMRQRNMGWRLDYVLVSPSLAQKAQSCVATREYGTSDHGPVTAVFEAPGVSRPTGTKGPAPEAETTREPPADAKGSQGQLGLPLD